MHVESFTIDAGTFSVIDSNLRNIYVYGTAHFFSSRGVRNDASLVPPIRQTASIFKQPVTIYKTQEGKVKDIKHGNQEKPKQVSVGYLSSLSVHIYVLIEVLQLTLFISPNFNVRC